MELLIFFALLVPVLAGAGATVYRKVFSSDAKAIDQLKYPTLHRIQRVVRNNNSKMRELEFNAKQAQYKLETAKKEVEIFDAIEDIKDEHARKHSKAVNEWAKEFNAIDEVKRKEKERAEWEEKQRIEREHAAKIQAEIEARRAEADRKAREEYERRQTELAQWTATEIARQKLKDKESATIKSLMKKTKKEDLDEGYASRRVNVHLANLRKSPSDKAKKVGLLEMGDKVTISHWAIGTTLYENNVWFKIEGANGTESGWIWSGALDSLSTSGIRRHYVEEKKKASQEETDTIFQGMIAEDIL